MRANLSRRSNGCDGGNASAHNRKDRQVCRFHRGAPLRARAMPARSGQDSFEPPSCYSKLPILPFLGAFCLAFPQRSTRSQPSATCAELFVLSSSCMRKNRLHDAGSANRLPQSRHGPSGESGSSLDFMFCWPGVRTENSLRNSRHASAPLPGRWADSGPRLNEAAPPSSASFSLV